MSENSYYVLSYEIDMTHAYAENVEMHYAI